MKDDVLFPYYVVYLGSKLNEGRLSDGSLSLLKISESAFEDFKYRFENEELFHSNMVELYKSEMRDKKIDDIFNDLN